MNLFVNSTTMLVQRFVPVLIVLVNDAVYGDEDAVGCEDAPAVEALRQLVVGADAAVPALGVVRVLVGSGVEVGVEDELRGDLDDVLAVNRLVVVLCLRCRGGRRGRGGGRDGCWRACRGGRCKFAQVVDTVGVGAGQVVHKGVMVLSLVLVLRHTRC